MNIKKENRLKLISLVNHRNKIKASTYPDSYYAAKETMLNLLAGLIKTRVYLSINKGHRRRVLRYLLGEL